MSLLERVIIAHKCRSMHHYIAMEALNQIGSDDAEAWKAMLLRFSTHFLDGSKAPDAQFKDFQNHVLHVEDGEWGGARDAAMDWYGRSVEALREKNWSDAAFCLGVLSHYYADVCQPFHTDQSEEESVIHRAVEWSIVKSVDSIFEQLEQTGYPEIESGEGRGFVADMVLEAAQTSHQHYQTFIDHYDLDVGVQDPPAGVDETMFDAVCEMVGLAVSGFASLLTRAIDEAAVEAPKTTLSVRGYLASVTVPIHWITKKLVNRSDRRAVEKTYREFQKTGKVIKTLSDDDKLVRKLHARQVLRVPLKDLDEQELEPIGTKHVPWEQPEEEDFIDEAQDDSEELIEDIEDEEVIVEEISEDEALEADVEVEAEAFDEDDDEEVVIEEAASKLSRAERRELKRQENAAKKEAKAEAKRARAEAKRIAREEAYEVESEDDEEVLAEEEFEAEEELEFEGEIDLDAKEQAEEVEILDLESADPDNEITEFEDAYENSDDFEAELAELAAIDLDDEIGAATLAAEQDFASEEVATAHLQTDRLGLESPVVDAPSIGRKTAKRLAKANIRTIIDLLDADPEMVADKLNVGYITAETILDWQDQTMLMMEVPGLRTHDVQVLVGAGIRSGEDLAKASAHEVFRSAMDFLSTDEGERVSRFDDEALAEAEVEEWIGLAKQEAA